MARATDFTWEPLSAPGAVARAGRPPWFKVGVAVAAVVGGFFLLQWPPVNDWLTHTGLPYVVKHRPGAVGVIAFLAGLVGMALGSTIAQLKGRLWIAGLVVAGLVAGCFIAWPDAAATRGTVKVTQTTVKNKITPFVKSTRNR